MKGTQQMLSSILTPKTLKRGLYRAGYSLCIYEVAHTIFLEVKTYEFVGNTIEILKCINREQGLFKLLTRKAENKVPMSQIILRHQKFPLGCIVRLKKPKLILPPLNR